MSGTAADPAGRRHPRARAVPSPTQSTSTAVSPPPGETRTPGPLRSAFPGSQGPCEPSKPVPHRRSSPGTPEALRGPPLPAPAPRAPQAPPRAAPPRFQISSANAHWPAPHRPLPLASPASGDWRRRNPTAGCLLVAPWPRFISIGCSGFLPALTCRSLAGAVRAVKPLRARGEV